MRSKIESGVDSASVLLFVMIGAQTDVMWHGVQVGLLVTDYLWIISAKCGSSFDIGE